MDTAYMRAKTDKEREALAHEIAHLRLEGVPWDGPGGIVDSRHLVSSATQGRALLRKYKLDAQSGGPVEILPSYDRYEINLATGRRKGYREPVQGPAPNATGHSPRTPQSKRSHESHAREPAAPGGAAQPGRVTTAARADPLLNFAYRIARETGRQVPIPNPHGPTTRALVLFVLRDPGATATSGANETNVLDPFLNRDPTSFAQQAALRAANIDPSVCVWWNASPFHLGYKGMIRDHDSARGARYLREFVSLCPDLAAVVAMGESAHVVARRAWRGDGPQLPRLLFAPHPMIYGRGGAERKASLAASLSEVASLIQAHQTGRGYRRA